MDGTTFFNPKKDIPDLNLTALKNEVSNLDSLGVEGLRNDQDLLSLKKFGKFQNSCRPRESGYWTKCVEKER